MPFRIDRSRGADIAVSIALDDAIAAAGTVAVPEQTTADRLIGHLDEPPAVPGPLWSQAGSDGHHGGTGIDHLYDHAAPDGTAADGTAADWAAPDWNGAGPDDSDDAGDRDDPDAWNQV